MRFAFLNRFLGSCSARLRQAAKQLGWCDEAGNLMSMYDLFKWEKAEAIARGALTIP